MRSPGRLLAPLTLVTLLAAASPAGATPPTVDADPWFGRDKALHFSVCAGITGAGYGVAALATSDLRLRIVFGAGAGVLAGAAKELLDLTGLGDPSWKDFAWDVLGSAVGVGIAITIDLALRAAHPAPAR